MLSIRLIYWSVVKILPIIQKKRIKFQNFLHMSTDDKLTKIQSYYVLYPRLCIHMIQMCFSEQGQDNVDWMNNYLSLIKASSLWSFLDSYSIMILKVWLRTESEAKNRGNYEEISRRDIDSLRLIAIKINIQLLEVGDSRYKRTRDTGRGQNTVEMESIRAYSLPGVTRSEF